MRLPRFVLPNTLFIALMVVYGSISEVHANTLDSLSAALPGSAEELIAHLSDQLAKSDTDWPAEERARIYYLMGVSHFYTGKYRVSNVYYREALELYDEMGDIERQEAVWNNKGIYLDLLGLFWLRQATSSNR